MTVNELIEKLSALPAEQRELQALVQVSNDELDYDPCGPADTVQVRRTETSLIGYICIRSERNSND